MKKALTVISVIALVSCLFFLNAGNLLTVADKLPERADLIVVLGGGTGARILRGIDLYTSGLAPRVLLTGLDAGDPKTNPTYLSWEIQHLVISGVPLEHIFYETISNNSHDEAINTLALMRQNGWRRAIVVSDPPHMRRLRLTWGRTFRGTGCSYALADSRPVWWDPQYWWRNEHSAKFVISEYSKLVWYWFKY